MNETTPNTEPLQLLREPFPASAISQLPKGGALLDFVGHAATTDRLLTADPHWTWEPFALDDRGLPALDYDAQGKPVGLWIKLTVCGVTRPGYGTCEARKNEPIKELIGDALRNAAMRFGVALDLWAKSDLESQKSSDEPSIPHPQQRAQQPQNGQQRAQPQQNGNAPKCKKCGGDMWDNRAKKASGQISEKSPDFKCKDRENCDGAIWPPKPGEVAQARENSAQNARTADSLGQWAADPDAELAHAYNLGAE